MVCSNSHAAALALNMLRSVFTWELAASSKMLHKIPITRYFMGLRLGHVLCRLAAGDQKMTNNTGIKAQMTAIDVQTAATD